MKNKFYGDLIRTLPCGKVEILEHAKPWGVLQNIKKDLERQGVKNLKLKHQE